MFDNFSAAKGRSPESIALSLTIHCALVVAMVAAGYTVESIVAPRRIASIQLMAPPPPVKRIALRISTPTVRSVVKLPLRIATPLVMVRTAPATPVIIAQAPVIAAEPVLAALLPTPPPLKVQTGGFSTASAAPSGNNRTVQVATAGFGDTGVASSAATKRSVSSGGFGDGAVVSASTGSRGQVRNGGFGDTVSAAPSVGSARAQATPRATAAQILQKPRPVYTDEARKLEIEGEVQLEVVFGASGQVQILRVVRGLGHGLDENAALAAKAIRFVPAQRDGHTVDSTAMVHIIFQLAS